MNYNENIITDTSGCKDCHASCATCVLSDAEYHCTSCDSGYYLSYFAAN